MPWWSKHLQQQGYHALDCGPVPYEPTNLTTAFTGTTPGYHGINSFWKIHNQNELPKILSSEDVLMPQIWHWPSFQSLNLAVINTPITHPPSPLTGAMVSYPMKQTLHATYPRELQLELNKKGFKCAHDVSAFYKGEGAHEFYKAVSSIAEIQLQTCLELAKKKDLVFVNLTLADRVSHFFWSELNQSSENEACILKAYQFLDKALSQLENLVGPNDFMMVFSEIGFGPIDGFISIDEQLQKYGLQVLTKEGELDPTKSVAREAVQGSHGINIILDEIDPYKRRKTPYYEQKLNTVRETLLKMHFDNGEPIITSTSSAEELYEGPHVALMPDLIIKPANRARPPLGDPRWAKHVNRSLQTGWHREEGFLMLLGSNKIKAPAHESLKLQDIAPTLAHLMNCDTAPSCRGKSLLSPYSQEEYA